jgi:hypothetical protein
LAADLCASLRLSAQLHRHHPYLGQRDSINHSLGYVQLQS